MKTINKIMVAVDFSEHSTNAVQYAAKLAQDVGAHLLLINVYNQRDVDTMYKIGARVGDGGFSAEKFITENIDDRQKELDELAKSIQKGETPIETNVRIGVPHEALLQEIEKKSPDLLVMGTKGRSDLMDMIIGSCARKMFQQCPIPLLSLRPEKANK